jgi:hypothetical protein
LSHQANKLFNESVELVKANCSAEEYENYGRRMAHVTGRLFFLSMEPIYCEHISLAPSDTPPDFLDRWRQGKQIQS